MNYLFNVNFQLLLNKLGSYIEAIYWLMWSDKNDYYFGKIAPLKYLSFKGAYKRVLLLICG